MDNTDEVDRLFFEFANKSRLNILRLLQNENLKMQEIARRLDLTATEAFRQLERLSSSALTQKQSDGSYVLTHYGRLQLRFASTMEFASRNRAYFLNHDLSHLPEQFINRISEISGATLKLGLVESTTRSSQLIGEAEKFMWGISPEPLTQPFVEIENQIPQGVEYRLLSPQPPVKLRRLENRTLINSPAILAVTEKEASLLFRFVDGRIDYASFNGNDPTFLNWVKDLFLYLWDKAKTH